MVTAYAAIAVIASSNSRDDRQPRGGGGMYSYGAGPRLFLNLSDLLWYWDPFYSSHRRQRMAAERGQQGMSFVEAIFSWVFGDGDPNAEFDRRRWQAVCAPVLCTVLVLLLLFCCDPA